MNIEKKILKSPLKYGLKYVEKLLPSQLHGKFIVLDIYLREGGGTGISEWDGYILSEQKREGRKLYFFCIFFSFHFM